MNNLTTSQMKFLLFTENIKQRLSDYEKERFMILILGILFGVLLFFSCQRTE